MSGLEAVVRLCGFVYQLGLFCGGFYMWSTGRFWEGCALLALDGLSSIQTTLRYRQAYIGGPD